MSARTYLAGFPSAAEPQGERPPADYADVRRFGTNGNGDKDNLAQRRQDAKNDNGGTRVTAKDYLFLSKVVAALQYKIPLCSAEEGATRLRGVKAAGRTDARPSLQRAGAAKRGRGETERRISKHLGAKAPLRRSAKADIQRPMSTDQGRATATATTDICIRRGSWVASENVLVFVRFRSNLSCADRKRNITELFNSVMFRPPSETRQIFLRRLGCPSLVFVRFRSNLSCADRKRNITELSNSVIFRPPAKHGRSSCEGWVALRRVAQPKTFERQRRSRKAP